MHEIVIVYWPDRQSSYRFEPMLVAPAGMLSERYNPSFGKDRRRNWQVRRHQDLLSSLDRI